MTIAIQIFEVSNLLNKNFVENLNYCSVFFVSVFETDSLCNLD